MEPAQQQIVSTRPKLSASYKARKITVISNHFPLEGIGKDFKIYLHSVKVDPEIANDSRSLINRIFKAAKPDIIKTYGAVVNSGWFVLSVKPVDSFSTTVRVEVQNYVYYLTQARETAINSLFADNVNADPAKQALNVFIKEIFRSLGYKEFGRLAKFYNPALKKEVDKHQLDILRGFMATFRVVHDETSLTKVRPKLLLDFSSRIVQKVNLYELMRQMSDEQIQEEIIGRTVITYHNNFRTYRIDGISNLTLNSPFPTPNDKGQQQKYSDYFFSKYKIQIRDKNQNLLLSIKYKRQPNGVKQKEEIYIVPELCYMTGLTEDMRQDFRVMQDVAVHTRLGAQERLDYILQGASDINKKLEKELNMKIDQKNNVVNAIQLEPPRIFVGGNGQIQVDSRRTDFILRDRTILAPAEFTNWAIVYTARGDREEDEVEDLAFTIKKAANAFGITVQKPHFERTNGTNARNFVDSIRKVSNTKNPDIILTFMPQKFKKNYKDIKKVCYSELGIPNQVVLDRAIRNRKTGKLDLSVCSKIILQMNCKLGLPLWSVDVPQNLPQQTMIIGIDVSHNTKNGRKSCLGFVASLDPEFCEFYSRICFQKSGQEISINNSLDTFVSDALIEYYKRNKKIPSNIVIYRDGVSDQQMKLVLEHEIPKIYSGIQKFKETTEAKTKSTLPNFNIGVAEIIVTKRIDDRFFTSDKSGKIYNPNSGTAIISGVTNPDPNVCDFYLVAQNVNQGTVTPTHYYILSNTTNFSLETFLELTYFQCFNYQNWMGSIRVPAPCQYAHKLCLIAGEMLQAEHKTSLNQTLYYL